MALLLLLTEAEEQAAGVGVGDDRLDAAREVLAVGDEEAAAVALGVHPAVVLPTRPHQECEQHGVARRRMANALWAATEAKL